MNFNLDPSSGYSDSYLDIKFIIKFDKSDKVIVRIYNEIHKEQLEILSIDHGNILSGNEAICSECDEMTGYINLFNSDKMNRYFRAYDSVRIKCEIEMFVDGKIIQEKEVVDFYNESKSLDAGIIPFDIYIRNSEIDIDNNVPLTLDIISGLERKFEICIRSEDEAVVCPFEVSVYQGKLTVNVPSELIYYDLQLDKNRNKKFKLYYVKYQGTTFSRLANRKYIPINNSEIKFKVNKQGFTPQPQKFQSPTGKELSDNFMISDRYFVPCPKQHSGLTSKNSYSVNKLMDLIMLLYESQDMRNISKEIQQFSNVQSDNKIKKRIQFNQIQKPKNPPTKLHQFQLLKTLSNAYDNISTKNMDIKQNVTTFNQPTYISQKEECLPCSRKKQKLKNAGEFT